MEDCDLDELESRLYSQIFHGSSEEEVGKTSGKNTDAKLQLEEKFKSFRYFSSENYTPSVHITINRAPHHQVVQQTNINNLITINHEANHLNSLVINTLPNNDPANDFFSQNQNITVNQYTIPVIIADYLSCLKNVSNTSSLTNSIIVPTITKKLLSGTNNVDNKVLSKRQIKRLNRKKHKENLRLKKLNISKQKIIYISDDCDNDYEILNDNQVDMIPEMCKVMPDDEIIYVPPPPVEVINVDDEINERSILLHSPESTSNDFLDNSTVENAGINFNFALHGLDFNSTAEFAKPNMPVDFCETESSCSTNDPNREFIDSTKSIVFDEVEFPKEDIFAEKSLDTFSSFITPKRTSQGLHSSEIHNEEKIDLNSNSSSSSTESDYDAISDKNSNPNLPMLSPMVTGTNSSTPRNKMKRNIEIEETITPIKKSAKKRLSGKKKKTPKKSGIKNQDEIQNLSNEVEKSMKKSKRKKSLNFGAEQDGGITFAMLFKVKIITTIVSFVNFIKLKVLSHF